MSDSYYDSPNSDVNAQQVQSDHKRSSTTAFGWVLMVLGIIGLLLSVFNFYAIVELGVMIDGVSHLQLLTDGFLSTLSKVGLLGAALALLLRAAWAKKAVIGGFLFSLTHSGFAGIIIIPVQSAAAGSEAEVFGVYLGFGFVALLSLGIYLGLHFYLRGQASELEFKFK